MLKAIELGYMCQSASLGGYMARKKALGWPNKSTSLATSAIEAHNNHIVGMWAA